MPRYEGGPIRFDDELAIDRGGSMIWCLFPGKWYDIGSFFLPDGSHTGWYANFCTPVKARGDNWFSTDLFLDHWASSSGERLWLDEDEYAAAIAAGHISENEQQEVEGGRREVAMQLGSEWPPKGVGEFDLKRANELLPHLP